MDIRKRGLGIIIDDLITTSQKLWHLQEIHMDENATDKDIADSFRKIQSLNVRRNALINELDKLEPDVFTTTEKTYK